ncbi:preprotein translocase subunit SecY [Clostridium sp. D2Q-14]|uniref:preprotein translocase subunit SecY n=1 Tax=Anaeromonas gelatinilytica TaxID=2683194 RepID=UPI00193B3331|nr:preprotein translocase subunit SecY [Anaeromonas gelatinilytica]MBS4535538.1 preprotein translocase subunit SecY [Anaeromonas gelatinilytica]
MLSTLKNAWKIPDLRKKILFTVLMLGIFRLGSNIPIPFINKDIIKQLFEGSGGGVLELFNMMSGGAFGQMTIFALNIYPYITASIVIQLLTIVIPRLEALAKEGEAGKKKIAQYTRYLTVVFALVQAIGISVGLFQEAIIGSGFLPIAVVVITITAGTAFLMWLGEQITENGIGNGISLIIFTGIISRIPSGIYNALNLWLKAKTVSLIELILFVIVAVVVIAGVVAIQEGQRKIPVQYAKRVVGRKMYGGQSTHIPIKVLMAGVIPVIFASSLLAFPQTLAFFFESWAAGISKWLSPHGSPGVWIYSILSVILIIFFTYFYTAIQFNPVEYANNLKQNGGFIPGIRPGRPTSEYLNRVITRITLVGAVALALIATLPTIISSFGNLNIGFGGTALLIVVGVALETVKQMESQMMMRHYKGFLK